MGITSTTTVLNVADHDLGVAWYSDLFGREPDRRPMERQRRVAAHRHQRRHGVRRRGRRRWRQPHRRRRRPRRPGGRAVRARDRPRAVHRAVGPVPPRRAARTRPATPSRSPRASERVDRRPSGRLASSEGEGDGEADSEEAGGVEAVAVRAAGQGAHRRRPARSPGTIRCPTRATPISAVRLAKKHRKAGKLSKSDYKRIRRKAHKILKKD